MSVGVSFIFEQPQKNVKSSRISRTLLPKTFNITFTSWSDTKFLHHGVILSEALLISGNGSKQLKKFLECCSFIGVVFPAFQHDFIHFEWAHVWFCQ